MFSFFLSPFRNAETASSTDENLLFEHIEFRTDSSNVDQMSEREREGGMGLIERDRREKRRHPDITNRATATVSM